MFVCAMQSPSHPIQAQIVPIRRCNLDCAYCNEYDKTSRPVPLETMLRRIDRLTDLDTAIITLSGGEPAARSRL
jgi:MoaA/NifB/PqqE/SkfB family radical SAM enzyme